MTITIIHPASYFPSSLLPPSDPPTRRVFSPSSQLKAARKSNGTEEERCPKKTWRRKDDVSFRAARLNHRYGSFDTDYTVASGHDE